MGRCTDRGREGRGDRKKKGEKNENGGRGGGDGFMSDFMEGVANLMIGKEGKNVTPGPKSEVGSGVEGEKEACGITE